MSPLGNSLPQPRFHDPLATTILLSVPVNLTYRHFTGVEANGLCAFISLKLSKVCPCWNRSMIAFTWIWPQICSSRTCLPLTACFCVFSFVHTYPCFSKHKHIPVASKVTNLKPCVPPMRVHFHCQLDCTWNHLGDDWVWGCFPRTLSDREDPGQGGRHHPRCWGPGLN